MKNLLGKEYKDIRKIFDVIEGGESFIRGVRRSSGEQLYGKERVKFMVMSDSIIISIEKNLVGGFSELVGICSQLIKSIIDSLSEPIFIRGAIVCGEISQGDRVVFGPGLTSAYLLENEVAQNMRCIISPELYESSEFAEYLRTHKMAGLKDSCVGLYFIDFIRHAKN